MKDVEGSPDEIIQFPCFGVRRYEGRQASLELRPLDGSLWGMSYVYFVRAEFHPDKGMVIYFTGHRVEIEGRNLKVVCEFLNRFALVYLQAIADSEVKDDLDVWVSNIRVIEDNRLKHLEDRLRADHEARRRKLAL